MASTVLAPSTMRPSASENCRLATAFESALGWMAVEFDDRQLCRVVFGQPTLSKLMAAHRSRDLEWVDEPQAWVADLLVRLEDFANGRPQDFADVAIDTDLATPFTKSVVRECRKLAWGHTATYAEIAKRVGRPGAARAVGNVMASNPFPLVVPCHRVTGSGGGLGGYSAPGGLATKRRLLEMEGAL